MKDVLDKIAEMFPVAETMRDETGCLAAVARSFQTLGPSLVLLADCNGRLLAADDLGSGADPGTARALARTLAAYLAEDTTCIVEFDGTVELDGTVEYDGAREPRLAFGVGIDGDEGRAILGGLVRQDADARQQLAAIWPLLTVCGELARCALCRKSDEGVLRTRIRHLLSEQDTLKVSHAEAIAVAIEQREERIREQQYHEALRELCHAAEAANRAKSQFLANVSHELRTPLHGILSFASLGIEKSEAAAADKLTGYFEKIECSGKILLTLVNDVLDMARLESGKTSFEYARTDLRITILAVSDEFNPRAAQRGIRIESPDADFNGSVIADQSKMTQVLRNLLGNAVKFAPDGSTIEIDAKRRENSIVVSIQDRGPGIPEDEIESIFDKFIQSSTTGNTSGGTGLGLAICREIIDAHEGHIWARNRPGEGAVFSFEIPLDPSHAAPSEDADDSPSEEVAAPA